MQVTLLGLGGGTPESITAEARAALESAELVIGAERLLDALPEDPRQRRYAVTRSGEIAALLLREEARSACVAFSGDTGFWSGARTLLPLLREHGIEPRVLPGISSVQLLAARLRRPWQDWTLCSAHGTDCDPVAALLRGKPAFFLTGGECTPATLCRALSEAGLGGLRVTVGEDLAYADERVVETTAEACSMMRFAPLSVLLVEAAPRPDVPVGGLSDADFVRGGVPMTKQEVRAAVRSKLAVRRGDVVWDVGAGTGSVSVELALTASEGSVYAVERREDACELIEENRRRFGAWNLRVVRGTAPEALRDLPEPDAVFVGGSNGALRQILDAVLERAPSARLCVSAITLETVSAALDAVAEAGLSYEIVQLAVSRTKKVGGRHLLLAGDPVFLVAAHRDETP